MRSCSTQRPPASIRRQATGSSRSAPSSWSITSLPAAAFSATSIPSGTCRKNAERVHGLTRAFLAKHKRFAEEADDILAFIGEAKLVMHNAPFDLGFLNAELERIRRAPIPAERTVDTLTIARRKYPGAPASLDALCRRFGVDRSMREKHGALLDAELLTVVYLELTGGRQPGLELQRAPPASARRADPRWRARRPSAAPARADRGRGGGPCGLRRDAEGSDLERLSGGRQGVPVSRCGPSRRRRPAVRRR